MDESGGGEGSMRRRMRRSTGMEYWYAEEYEEAHEKAHEQVGKVGTRGKQNV
jgi:hypothetical protein